MCSWVTFQEFVILASNEVDDEGFFREPLFYQRKKFCMKVVIEAEVLEYDKLPENVRQTLLRNEAQTLGEIWQSDFVEEQFTEKCEAIGFTDVRILYSGFGSQGDGACFDAQVDLKKVFAHLGILHNPSADWSCHIEMINSRYNHERTRKIVFEIFDDENPGLEAKIEEKIEALRLELCQQLYRALEADYYLSISDEACLEYLRARRFVRREGLEKLITKKVPCEGVQVI